MIPYRAHFAVGATPRQRRSRQPSQKRVRPHRMAHRQTLPPSFPADHTTHNSWASRRLAVESTARGTLPLTLQASTCAWQNESTCVTAMLNPATQSLPCPERCPPFPAVHRSTPDECRSDTLPHPRKRGEPWCPASPASPPREPAVQQTCLQAVDPLLTLVVSHNIRLTAIKCQKCIFSGGMT